MRGTYTAGGSGPDWGTDTELDKPEFGVIIQESTMRSMVLIFLITLVGCTHNSTTVIVDRKIEGPKVIALDAPRTPWVVEIETRLRQSGFQVMRWASQRRVRERVTESRTEEFQEAATRYVLVIDGFAPLEPMNRCIGGGYRFDHLTAELVDTRTNETMLNVSGSGYSENCPLSGNLFSNIISAVQNAWR